MNDSCRTFALVALLSALASGADLTVGTATAQAKQRATGFIQVPAGVDAGMNIPVIVINGAKPGPKLALVAGSHGTEYASIIALEKLGQSSQSIARLRSHGLIFTGTSSQPLGPAMPRFFVTLGEGA